MWKIVIALLVLLSGEQGEFTYTGDTYTTKEQCEQHLADIRADFFKFIEQQYNLSEDEVEVMLRCEATDADGFDLMKIILTKMTKGGGFGHVVGVK